MSLQPDKAWDELWNKYEGFRSAIARNRAVNVNSQSLRDEANQIVQLYFRNVRPHMKGIGLGEANLQDTDIHMQELLRLSQGQNPKRSYLQLLKQLVSLRSELATAREYGLSEQQVQYVTKPDIDTNLTEAKILQTLKTMLPSSAASYEQAIRDLKTADRISLRGTAVELREALREVLDHLAPDSDVMKMPGFKLEPDQKKPTMRQKARFILRSRGQAKTSMKAPEDVVNLVDELVASLVRSVYERGSLSTHIASVRGSVQQLKMYIDTVLAELLEIHSVSDQN